MARPAFTIVELIVVISVIVLILAIAIPGLSTITADSRFNEVTQTVNGALTAAYYRALADGNLTAVRFLPAEWDEPEADPTRQAVGRMHLVTYVYRWTSAADPNDSSAVVFGEYFRRQEGSASVRLPPNLWVAPVEALDTQQRRVVGNGGREQSYGNFGRDFVLSGKPGSFDLDAAWNNNTPGDLLQADDFLIVFEPDSGLRSLVSLNRLKAYVPVGHGYGAIEGTETDRDREGHAYQRYNFAGIAVYERPGFVELGEDPAARQDYLRQRSRPYLVHRRGGGLVMGTRQYAGD